MQALSGSTAAWKRPSTPAKHRCQALAVADVTRLEAHATARERLAEVRLARIEVEHDDLLGAVGQQPVDDVRADEAGTAGDEEPLTLDLHAGASWRGTRTDARARRTPSAPPRAGEHATKALAGAASHGRAVVVDHAGRDAHADRASARRTRGPAGRPPEARRGARRARCAARPGCSPGVASMIGSSLGEGARHVLEVGARGCARSPGTPSAMHSTARPPYQPSIS